MNVYRAASDAAIKPMNFKLFKIALAYKDINPTTAIPAIPYADKKLECSEMEINKV